MTKPVTLSEHAFKELRRVKRAGESSSEAILRLIGESKEGKKDPRLFLRLRLERVFSPETHRRLIKASRRADRRNRWVE